MAIAVNGGHVARALDFYNTSGKYFILGGVTAWSNEEVPTPPALTDYKLNGVVGLKKVDTIHMVVPVPEDEVEDGKQYIQYRNQKWRTVVPSIETTLTSAVALGSTTISLASVEGMTVGSKLRINNVYEGKIENISGLDVTLDTRAPQVIASGNVVLGGAQVEGAKYVYVDCSLNYDAFPLETYRQIGLCTRVSPDTKDIIKATDADFSSNYLGILEILDNRPPSTRDIDQRELLSLIVEF